jgi:hypothetical protein
VGARHQTEASPACQAAGDPDPQRQIASTLSRYDIADLDILPENTILDDHEAPDLERAHGLRRQPERIVLLRQHVFTSPMSPTSNASPPA